MLTRFHKALFPFILLIGLFLRVYRTSDLLGFYYDQGRDALVIWKFLYEGNLFLVGPTTGIDGILLGPFFYLLLTPFYLFGQGDPVVPAVGLALLNVVSIFFLYHLAKKYFSIQAALLSSLLIVFSFTLIKADRWLSNPTPLPLFSISIVYILLKLKSGNKTKHLWPVLGLFLGLSLQLEAASAVFFIPAVSIILFLFRSTISFSAQKVFLFIMSFILTLLPQLVFELKNNFLITITLFNLVQGQENSVSLSSEFLITRTNFLLTSLFGKFAIGYTEIKVQALVILLSLLCIRSKILNPNFVLILVWVTTPLIFLLFYLGNNGYVWDYYLTGVFPIWILLVSHILTSIHHNHVSKTLFAGVVLLVSLSQNIPMVANFLRSHPTYPTLTSSLSAVNWVYQDSKDNNFNYDVYVPPVLPDAYDYLFLWMGTKGYNKFQSSEQVDLLYTVYEPDPPHPERLDAWLKRQDSIATVSRSVSFGPVSIDVRLRNK